MLRSSRSQWLAALALVVGPMLLTEAFCRKEPDQRATGRLTKTTGVLRFSVGDYYLHGHGGSLRLICPAGGGGSGPTRRRWCFTDRAQLKLGSTVTVLHEPSERLATVPIAVVHEVRTSSESLLHDVR
jgi:hypothetical protein